MITIRELLERHNFNPSMAYEDIEHNSQYEWTEFVEEYNNYLKEIVPKPNPHFRE